MRSCAKLYPPHSPCHEIFFPLPPRHDRRIDNPLSFIPRRTNGHWLLACSRVCHRENGVPSNRELALFFLHAVCWPTQCAVETAHDARWRCANESPQIGPFFRPMSGVVRRLERLDFFLSPLCSGYYAEITGSQTIARFLFPFLFTQRVYVEVSRRYYSVSTKRLYRDPALTSVSRPRYNLMRSN